MRNSIKVRIEDKRDEFIDMIMLYEGEMTEKDYQHIMNPFMKKNEEEG